MSDMPDKLFFFPKKYTQGLKRFIGYIVSDTGDVSYTRTDLTYPKEDVDDLIEEFQFVMKYLSEHRNYEFMTKDARSAIAKLQGNGTGEE